MVALLLSHTNELPAVKICVCAWSQKANMNTVSAVQYDVHNRLLLLYVRALYS